MNNFDERARDWDADPAKVERARVVAMAMRAAIPFHGGMTALEYGCGTGLLSFALQPDFATITLADTSDGMLNVLSAKIKSAGVNNMKPIKLDLTSQPLPDDRFDVIYSLMTLHHIPETETILGHFNSLLHPGGFLCIIDLEKEDGAFHGQDVKNVHRGFVRSDLKRQLETAGFAGIHFSTVFSIKKLADGMEKIFPLFLMVAMKTS